MSGGDISAKAMLLDLLRASEPHSWPVSRLVAVGAIFGINENAIRVNITRLLAKGMIGQDERGFYRLSEAASPLRDWINLWRKGEDRVIPWQGNWLMLSISPELRNDGTLELERAARRLGFRAVWGRCWVRPDNLRQELQALAECLHCLSGRHDFLITRVDAIATTMRLPSWQTLWGADKLAATYRRHIKLLRDSTARMAQLSVEAQLRETFVLGGEVIHVLALDPLLPREMVDVSLRRKLTDAMARYETSFRTLWAVTFSDTVLNHFPNLRETQLSRATTAERGTA